MKRNEKMNKTKKWRKKIFFNGTERPSRTALYGNFDLVEKKTKEMLGKFENNRHIANLGHGVYPDTDPEKVKCFIETVKSYN